MDNIFGRSNLVIKIISIDKYYRYTSNQIPTYFCNQNYYAEKNYKTWNFKGVSQTIDKYWFSVALSLMVWTTFFKTIEKRSYSCFKGGNLQKMHEITANFFLRLKSWRTVISCSFLKMERKLKYLLRFIAYISAFKNYG